MFIERRKQDNIPEEAALGDRDWIVKSDWPSLKDGNRDTVKRQEINDQLRLKYADR